MTFHENLAWYANYNSELDPFATVSFVHQVELKLPYFSPDTHLVQPGNQAKWRKMGQDKN